MSFNFSPKRIFDFLVVGGLFFLLTQADDETGWKLIGLGILGFFAYVLIRYKM